MPAIRPTTKGELHWWKDSIALKTGDKRTDMYVMEAITQSRYKAFGPDNPMAYRLVFTLSSTFSEVWLGYLQQGRYSSGKKTVKLKWSFESKTAASQWFSKIKRKVTTATTFNALMNNISALRKDARKHKGKKRG